jgi:hypothetical protein
VRLDTPQIRGTVAAVPHLLEIVPEPSAPAWASIPEYTVHPPAAAPTAPAESTVVVTAEPAVEAVAAQADIPEGKPAVAAEQKESSPVGSEPANATKE